MGVRYVKGLGAREKAAYLAARAERPFTDLADFARRTRMGKKALHKLAEAGAFAGLGLDRRAAIWELSRLAREPLAGLDWLTEDEAATPDAAARRRAKQPRWLRDLAKEEQIAWDYRASLHSTLGHPMEAYRERLIELGYPEAAAIARMQRGAARFAGLVICRQRPQTATGVVFMTLEDETGFVNVVIWSDVFERHARVAKTSVLLEVRGHVQEEAGVVHLVATSLHDLADALASKESSRRLGDLEKSRDFH
jgi:error-prone DNA polymerase